MVIAYLVFLGVVAVERGFELALSRRHERRLRARGAIEVGRRHFRFMVLLHTLFLPACALEVVWLDRPFLPVIGTTMLALALLAQAIRYWVVRTLGDRWTVRVLVPPDEPLVRSGPFRFLRHPNYVAVAIELVAIPLVHGAWWTASSFTLANAVLLLGFRIPAEESALGPRSSGVGRAV